MTKNPTPSAKPQDTKQFPFLTRVLITFTRLNSAGVEQKEKEEVVFKLTQEAGRMPWFALRNYLVPKYLTSKYGPEEVGWQRIYEIQIIQQVRREDPTDITDIPLRIMTLEQLDRYVKKWELNVPVFEFFSVEKAREMVELRQEDEKAYQKYLAEYREGKQRSYPEMDGLRGDQGVETEDVSEFERLMVSGGATPAKPKPKVDGEVVTEPITMEKTYDDQDPFSGV